MLELLQSVPVLGVMEYYENFRWSVENFYGITAGVLGLAIHLGFRVFGLDPDDNKLIGGMICGAVICGVAYATRGIGLVGILGTGITAFIATLAFSNGEAAKSLLVSILSVGVFAGMAHFVVARSALTADDLGGIARAAYNGKLEKEEVAKDIYEKKNDEEEERNAHF